MAEPTPLEDLFAAFVARGDERALQELLRRSAPPLRRLARRLGAGADDADDLVQETIVAAIQVADRFDHTRPLLPWLKGIMTFRAAHLARDTVRRRRLHADDHDVEQVAAATPSAADAAAGREFAHDLDQALAELPPHYRSALAQHLLEQRSPRDIATAGAVPRATVRVHLHRGLRSLRELLRRWSAPVLAVLLFGRSGRAASWPQQTAIAASWFALAMLTWWLLRGTPPPPMPANGLTPASAAATGGEAVAVAGAVDEARIAATAVPASPTRPDQPSLTVRVLATDGTPVPGVAVTATPQDGSDPVMQQRTVVSDANGLAHWPAAPHGPLDVRADRGGSLALTTARAETTIHTLTLAPAPPAHGLVVDAHGTPVPGARVWLARQDGGPWRGSDVAVTASDGTFELANVPDGAFVAARHEHHAGSDLVPVPAAADASAKAMADSSEGPPTNTAAIATAPPADGASARPPVRVMLGPPGGRIAVHVLDEREQPIADALVLVGDAMDGTPLFLADGAAPLRAPPWQLRTDHAGAATTGAFAVGTQPLVVRAAGHAPFVGTVDLVAGVTSTPTVVLFRGSCVRGRVVDDRGEPLAQATIVARSADPGGDLDTVTAADGTFVFDGLPRGEVVLAARAHGFVPTPVCLDATNTLAPIELRLRRARVLTGRIDGLRALDPSRVPPIAARLRATWPASALQPEPLQAMVDGDGAFAFDGAPEGRPMLALQVRGEPLWRALDPFVQWNGDRVEVRLPASFAADAFVHGTLRRDDGAPIGNARLFVHQDGRRWQEIGLSRPDGSYRLGPLPAGDYALFAETTQPAAPTVRSEAFALAAGSTHRLDLTAAATGELQLALRRRDGGSLGGLAITLVDVASGRRAAVLAGADARQRLVAGDYRLFVMSDRAVWLDGAAVHVEAGQVTVAVHAMAPARRCRLLPRGVPLPADAGERAFTLHDEHGLEVGAFTLPHDAPLHLGAVLAPGRYELRHRVDDAPTWTGTFVVEPGDAPCTIDVPVAHSR